MYHNGLNNHHLVTVLAEQEVRGGKMRETRSRIVREQALKQKRLVVAQYN